MLATGDLAISSATLPKMLGILFLPPAREISLGSCQAHKCPSSTVMDTGVLVAVAFVCSPLRYEATMMDTPLALLKIGLVAVGRAVALVTPLPVLARRLPFCASHGAQHTAIVRLASTA